MEAEKPKMEFTEVYTLTLNQHGQVTIPKALREKWGVSAGDSFDLYAKGKKVEIRNHATWSEVFKNLDKIRDGLPEEAKKRMREDAGKTASELLNEWADSPEGQQYFKEKYDL